MKNDKLIKLYLNYLEEGISLEALFTIMKYDYDLFIKKQSGLIDANSETNIVSFEDAMTKFKALEEAYKELVFPGYKLTLKTIVNKNTTLD